MKSVRQLYNRLLRPLLPRDVQVLNGVPVKSRRFLDRTIEHPNHEKYLIQGIENACHPEDTVVLVGAGYGVSTVRAARIGKTVIAFEAGREQFELATDTVKLNKTDNATIHHAIVGELRSANSPPEDASNISPAELPEGDVLILDCEGAEVMIIEGLVELPREIVVETHGFLGASTEAVQGVLNDRGYSSNVVGAIDENKDCLVVHAKKE